MSRVRQSVLLATFVAAGVIAHAQSEPFCPQCHFTPERNWMSDPNALVFCDREWTYASAYPSPSTLTPPGSRR